MKKVFCLLLVVVISLSFVVVTANEIVSVYVNGNEIESDIPAVIVNGSTMLPFRAVFNALGIQDSQITWNEQSHSIEVKSEGNFIFLAIGLSAAIVNDNMIMLNTMPYIDNGRTMVPVRFVSESLGANVEWDEINKKVNITK